MSQVAIRVPSVDALFDAWSVEPLARRPLSDEARERIVDGWTQVRKRATGQPSLTLRLPEAGARVQPGWGLARHRDHQRRRFGSAGASW